MNLPLFAGILAAALHVITGPDHLAAVLPFAIESKRRAWRVGLTWGVGHLAGMLFIGILFILFKDLIPIEPISNYSEILVGVVLIGIGIAALYAIFRKKKKHEHLHIHEDGEVPIIHKHEHRHHNGNGHKHQLDISQGQSNRAAFFIGVLHGLAGVAHFLLFLPILGFSNQGEAIGYIVGFAAGTVLAMTAFATVVGKIATAAVSQQSEFFYNGIRLAGGLFAIIIGLYWCFSF